MGVAGWLTYVEFIERVDELCEVDHRRSVLVDLSVTDLGGLRQI